MQIFCVLIYFLLLYIMQFLCHSRKTQASALKLGGYFMYHRAYHFDVTHFIDVRYLCVLYVTQNKQLLFTYTDVTVWFL
jgi:hypothetical protein